MSVRSIICFSIGFEPFKFSLTTLKVNKSHDFEQPNPCLITTEKHILKHVRSPAKQLNRRFIFSFFSLAH